MGLIRFLKNWGRLPRDTRASFAKINNKLEEMSKPQNDDSILLRFFLQDKALHCKEKGVFIEQYCNHEIIVSLTTYGERIDNVHLAIESIMQGSVLPNRIILWLSEDEFKGKSLPNALQLQQKRGLEIAYCNDIRSYKKLIPSLLRFPEAAIITIDDDFIYEYNLVERLINAHINRPDAVCACRMHRIRLEKNGNPQKYLDWVHCIHDIEESTLNFPTGCGGVLYPPKCFDKEVFNESAFMNLCHKADDIWFYSMALKNGTSRIWVKTASLVGYHCAITSYSDSLSFYNNSPIICGNDKQFQNVINSYALNLSE